MTEKPSRYTETLRRYLDAIALTRRPATVRAYRFSGLELIRYLQLEHPRVATFAELKRSHIEGWLRYMASGRKRPLCRYVRRCRIIRVRHFLSEVFALGWEEEPQEELFHKDDLPPQDNYLPRPLAPEADAVLQRELKAMGGLLPNSLLLMRATGIRIGELQNLELNALQILPDNYMSLRVPLGKLHSERVIPVDAAAVQIIDEIRRWRGTPQPLPHPDTGKPTHFLCMWPHGPRIHRDGLCKVLKRAAKRAGLEEHVIPHRLRHTYATEMLRAGMSLPVLMKILGHRTIRMTLLYAQVTQNDVQVAYLKAMDSIKARYEFPEPSETLSVALMKPITGAGILHALVTAASQMETFRRDHKNRSLTMKIQRLVERLRKLKKEFEDFLV